MSKPVADTDLRDYFDEATAMGEIVVLEKSEASEIWGRYFAGARGSFFHLPDSSWVVVGNSKSLGCWVEDLNSGNDYSFAKELRAQAPWNDDDRIFFAVNDCLVLSCPWRVFLVDWRCFLYLESDAPMVLAEGRFEQCVLFRPVGDAMWIAA